MKTTSLKLTKNDYEKIKCDAIYDEILNFKEQKGMLPSYVMLESDFIPDECRKEMVIEVDDIKIPILDLGVKPC